MKRIVFAAIVFSLVAQACSSSKEIVSQGSVPANTSNTATNSVNGNQGLKNTQQQPSQSQKENTIQKSEIRYTE